MERVGDRVVSVESDHYETGTIVILLTKYDMLLGSSTLSYRRRAYVFTSSVASTS